MYLKEAGSEDVNQINCTQDIFLWLALVNVVMILKKVEVS
jgi:hypothetical protein